MARRLLTTVPTDALCVQNVIEFHELRKKKAEENIQKKEAGTRITKSCIARTSRSSRGPRPIFQGRPKN